MADASVVLIEDSPPYAKLVELLVAEAVPEDVEVRHHETLAAGLQDLLDRDADCVLLDLGLPDAHGLEGLAALMAAGVTAPVVVLSGHDDEDLAVAAVAAGAQDYLVKGEERRGKGFARAVRFAIARHRAQERTEDLLRAREDRWRTLTHLAPVGIVEIAADGNCLFANDAVAELARRPREQLLALGWREAMHPDDRATFDTIWRAAAEQDGRFSREVRFVRPDGDVVWAHVTAAMQRDPWGTPAGWLGTLVDVTTARRAAEDLAEAERELRLQQQDVLAVAALARDSSVAEDPVAPLCAGGRRIVGADFAVLVLHDGAEQLVIDCADGVDIPPKSAVHIGGEASGSVTCFLTRERLEVADAAADPTVSPDWAQAAGARTAVFEPLLLAGEALGVLVVGWRTVRGPLTARASTIVRLLAAELGAACERRRLLDQLRDLARTDPLTGLANRRLWDERLGLELSRAERHGNALCVAMLDLDRFKPYNDRHGHQAGDRLLRETSAAWQGVLRTSDLLSRLGGDEFALLLPDCDIGCSRTIVERLQEVLHPEVGCSAGLVRWTPGEAAPALLARADEALYAAKDAGRGGIELR